MQRRIGRAVLAALSTIGLVVSGAMAANASSGKSDDHGKQRYGWVKVCQDVKRYDDGKADDYGYRGTYQVKDGYGGAWKFDLKGRYDCRQVKVHTGKISVRVLYKPDGADLQGYADRYVDVSKNAYRKVTFEYRAIDYGWVKVCQDVKRYDDGKADDNEYRGTYRVTDSRGRYTDVYLKGRYACDQVKVRTGKTDVRVTYRPDNTRLISDDEVYVNVYKGEYENVTFEYKAVDYGWVKVCQDVKRYDDGKADDNEYRGSYRPTDSYGDYTDVYLKGRYACDQVKVPTGRTDVKVTYQPEHTRLTSDDDEVYVNVYKGEYENVTFEYKAVQYGSAFLGRAAA